MTNKGNIATAWYTLSVIRSSAGYVFFCLSCLCLFSMQSQILSAWLTSPKTTPMWNMQRQCEKNILSNAAWSCLESLHPCNHFQTAISSYYSICFSFLSEVIQGIFSDHGICVTVLKHKNCVLYNRCKIGRWHSLLSKQSFGNDAQTAVHWIKQTKK